MHFLAGAEIEYCWSMQIGVRSEGFRGPSGQLLLFFGNKADAVLERLLCVVPPTPQFQFQLGAVPARLEPKKQIQVTPYMCHVHP